MRLLCLCWSVLLLGSVTVLGQPPVRDVVVINDASSPVPVVSRLAGDRHQYRFSVIVAPTRSFNCITIPVAAGQRLIVNQVSGDVSLPVGERGVIFISAGPITPFPGSIGGINTQHFFPLIAAGSNISVGPQAETYYFNQQPEIFSDIDLGVCLSRGPTPSAFLLEAHANVALSGRIVSLPE